MCRGLAPFTPFITDNIYQRLIPFIPASHAAKDPRSVHFLSFPEVREELFDEVIERRVTRMQAVVDMGRASRDRCTISLKTPLKSLVIVHPDQEYLEDVRSLEGYIRDELNVRDIVYSSDEDKYDVQYSCSVDWPSIGKRLKKDALKVKKALPKVSTPEIKEFFKTSEITVAGIALTRDNILVKRSLREGDASKLQEFNMDNDVLIILDVAMYPELEKDGLAREIINRVQRLRKKAGLVPTDAVGLEYRVLDNPDKIGLEEVFETQSAVIGKALSRPVDMQIFERVEGKEIIMEEDQKVRKATFLLRLVKL